MHLTTDQQQAIDHGEAVPLTIEGRERVLLGKDTYQRVQAVIPDDLPSIAEQRQMLRAIGKMAGWDDPEMHVYDHPWDAYGSPDDATLYQDVEPEV